MSKINRESLFYRIPRLLADELESVDLAARLRRLGDEYGAQRTETTMTYLVDLRELEDQGDAAAAEGVCSGIDWDEYKGLKELVEGGVTSLLMTGRDPSSVARREAIMSQGF